MGKPRSVKPAPKSPAARVQTGSKADMMPANVPPNQTGKVGKASPSGAGNARMKGIAKVYRPSGVRGL